MWKSYSRRRELWFCFMIGVCALVSPIYGDDDDDPDKTVKGPVVIRTQSTSGNSTDTGSADGVGSGSTPRLFIAELLGLWRVFSWTFDDLGDVDYPISSSAEVVGFTPVGFDQLIGLTSAVLPVTGPPQSLFYTNFNGDPGLTFGIESPGSGSLSGLEYDSGSETLWSYDALASTYYEFTLEGVPTGGSIVNPSVSGSGALGSSIAYRPEFDDHIVTHGTSSDGILTLASVVNTAGAITGSQLDLTPFQSTNLKMDYEAEGSNGTPSLFVLDVDNDQMYEVDYPPYVQHEEIDLVSGTTSGDQLGADVAFATDKAMVGIPGAVSERGSVLIRHYLPVVDYTLVAPGGLAGDRFGAAVDLASNTAFVGAPQRDVVSGTPPVFALDQGAAYVYAFDGVNWSPSISIESSDGAPGDQFGSAIDCEELGTYVAVGAPGEGADQGAVYIYRRQGSIWIEEVKLTAADGAPGDRFGEAVGLTSVTDPDQLQVAIGAPGHGSGQGAVYVFRRQSGAWALGSRDVTKIEDDFGAAGDMFGTALDFESGVLFIGAPGYDLERGAGYLYGEVAGSFELEQLFDVSGADQGDRFGDSVSVSADPKLVAIGSTASLASGVTTGATRVYAGNALAWRRIAIIVPDLPGSGDAFGASLDLSGCRLLIGSPLTDSSSSGVDSGSARIYGLGMDCNENGVSDLCEISSGAADCNLNLILDSCEIQPVACVPVFIRGYINDDEDLDIADVIALLEFLFRGETISCESAADVNGMDGSDIADVVFLLSFLYLPGEPPPSAPYPQCGVDPAASSSSSTCGSFDSCP